MSDQVVDSFLRLLATNVVLLKFNVVLLPSTSSMGTGQRCVIQRRRWVFNERAQDGGVQVDQRLLQVIIGAVSAKVLLERLLAVQVLALVELEDVGPHSLVALPAAGELGR